VESPERFRKTVTILFFDVVGPTALGRSSIRTADGAESPVRAGRGFLDV